MFIQFPPPLQVSPILNTSNIIPNAKMIQNHPVSDPCSVHKKKQCQMIIHSIIINSNNDNNPSSSSASSSSSSSIIINNNDHHQHHHPFNIFPSPLLNAFKASRVQPRDLGFVLRGQHLGATGIQPNDGYN